MIFEKNELREEIKDKIKELSPCYIEEASEKIFRKIIENADYINAKTVFIFVGTKGEPNTYRLLSHSLKLGKTVGVPLCLSDGEMTVIKIKNLETDLEKGHYGIMEPKRELPVISSDSIDFAVIPCVTCDYEGNRLGHGKGYYDRYLQHTKFTTCMICFEKLISSNIPLDSNDISIDMVITDV